ncbi:hypothetical protein Bbelb_186660 [Branchiostoma belcheri]|nr:hypothetical protein Bbelb_186660 [Branchiostoma belcheri]
MAEFYVNPLTDDYGQYIGRSCSANLPWLQADACCGLATSAKETGCETIVISSDSESEMQDKVSDTKTGCETMAISSDSESEMQDKVSDTMSRKGRTKCRTRVGIPFIPIQDSFDRFSRPNPSIPNGFKLMHRTPTSESFTEFDLLSGTFDSSSGGNEQLDVTSDNDSVIVISSESEGERDFSDIRQARLPLDLTLGIAPEEEDSGDNVSPDEWVENHHKRYKYAYELAAENSDSAAK